ncbi:MAG: sel1 repeat family protein [Elusimicrobiaceae bacterium]|nr:sel1 repeat family protein [Elusimicrobiaceae bacterium]
MKTFLFFLLMCVAGGLIYWAGFYQTPEQKQFAATLTAAQQGNLSSQVKAGDLYAQGTGTAQDGEQAVFWYRKAAMEGDKEALWKSAQAYIEGKLVPQDLEEAFPFLMLGAKQNDPRALMEISRFYAQGLGGVTRHLGESLYWLFQADKALNGGAKNELRLVKQSQPELYEQVENFVQDLAQAQAGDAQARLRVALAYEQGNAITQNAEEAVRWYTLAWEENKLPQAGFALAQLYQKGGLVEQDENKAAILWNELTQLPYPPAQYALGEMAYQAVPPRYEDAFAWFSNAAAGNYAPGQYMTGFMLMQGQGTARSVKLATTFFRSAAEQEYVSAQYVLGQIYWKGLGVPADKKAGRKWLEKAAQNGSEAAQALLEESSVSNQKQSLK